jgi:hypothetical protein
MMHTKCGETATCWNHLKGKCGSYFPRDFSENTVIHENGRVEYKRPQLTEEEAQEKGLLNSRIVVAHNPYLLLNLDCHANLEVVQSDYVMKYLFKYINKESDRVWFAAGQKNEILRYQQARCVGACEALWHLFAFPIVWCSHSVLGLPVHEQDEELLFYNDEKISKEGMKKKINTNTPLTAWMAANHKGNIEGRLNGTGELRNSRTLFYYEMPDYFVLIKKKASGRLEPGVRNRRSAVCIR